MIGKRDKFWGGFEKHSVEAEVMSGGRLFQGRHPATGNARSPTVDSRVHRITCCEDDDDRRRRHSKTCTSIVCNTWQLPPTQCTLTTPHTKIFYNTQSNTSKYNFIFWRCCQFGCTPRGQWQSRTAETANEWYKPANVMANQSMVAGPKNPFLRPYRWVATDEGWLAQWRRTKPVT